MKENESERSEDIKTVIEERNRLILTCQLLNEAITGNDKTKVQNLIIRVTGILSNIGGFCDKYSRFQINGATRSLAMFMTNPLTDLTYDVIRNLLPIISGIKVDFNKRPFKVIGLSIGNIGFKGEKR